MAEVFIFESGYEPLLWPGLFLAVLLVAVAVFAQGGEKSTRLLATKDGCLGFLGMPFLLAFALGMFLLHFDEFRRLEIEDGTVRLVYLFPRGTTALSSSDVKGVRIIRRLEAEADGHWYMEVDTAGDDGRHRHLSAQTTEWGVMAEAVAALRRHTGVEPRWMTLKDGDVHGANESDMWPGEPR